MIWHSETFPHERLARALAAIRSGGGTVVGSCPQGEKVRLTWTTPTPVQDVRLSA